MIDPKEPVETNDLGEGQDSSEGSGANEGEGLE
jgi:hypothetical protein